MSSLVDFKCRSEGETCEWPICGCMMTALEGTGYHLEKTPDLDRPLYDEIVKALRNHSSPTSGRGVHEGEGGFVVYEPYVSFIASEIQQQFERRLEPLRAALAKAEAERDEATNLWRIGSKLLKDNTEGLNLVLDQRTAAEARAARSDALLREGAEIAKYVLERTRFAFEGSYGAAVRDGARAFLAACETEKSE